MEDAKSNQSSGDGDDSDSDDEKKARDDESNVTKVELAENVRWSDVVENQEESSSAAPESRIAFLRRLSENSSISKRRRKVFFTYKARQRPRQPFMKQEELNQSRNTPPSAPPRPPSYYTNVVTPERHRPEIIRDGSGVRSGDPPLQSQAVPAQSVQPIQRQTQPPATRDVVSSNMPYPGMGTISNPLFNFAYWAPYPDSVPTNVTPCLAHLYQADSLFIVQQINILELLMWSYINVPNFYLIQNKNGHVIYYVYETTDLCMTTCCSGKRGFQLHVMDIYNNEVIYMNRPCGCTNFPCCYPVMEVYSPPLVPVGAIVEVFNPKKHEFTIIDADENVIFKIYGPLCFNCCGCCMEVDFTIHATDKDETEVGIIRREWGGFLRTLLADSDLFGITFPKDLDVRVKAVFLGALFFIEYLYFEG